jgi:hypothetical protein
MPHRANRESEMFGSEVLDVAIGLILVYLLLSLFATAVREALESVFKTRAVFLEAGIRELLDDEVGRGLARDFYRHPLISSLYRGPYDPGKESDEAKQGQKKQRERMTGANLPAYIPPRSFSTALVDLVVRGPTMTTDGVQQRQSLTLDALRAGIEGIGSAHVRRALLIAVDDAKGDLDGAKRNIEGWFDASMVRVSGWYKRRTHYWLLLIGVLTTVALNVNTITISQHLARNKAARELVVGRAEAIVADSATRALVQTATTSADLADAKANLQARMAALDSLNLPLGWNRVPSVGGAPISWFMQQFVGLLLTTLAITLGAPFWFDALDKIMTVKTTGSTKKKES